MPSAPNDGNECVLCKSKKWAKRNETIFVVFASWGPRGTRVCFTVRVRGGGYVYTFAGGGGRAARAHMRGKQKSD